MISRSEKYAESVKTDMEEKKAKLEVTAESLGVHPCRQCAAHCKGQWMRTRPGFTGLLSSGSLCADVFGNYRSLHRGQS